MDLALPLLLAALAGDGVLAGRAFDASGAPLAEVFLQAVRAEGPQPSSASAWRIHDAPDEVLRVVTEPDGSFRFEDLPDGRYRIYRVAWAMGGAAHEMTRGPVALGTDDLTLTPSCHTLVVRVTGDGGPLYPFAAAAGYAGDLMSLEPSTAPPGSVEVSPLLVRPIASGPSPHMSPTEIGFGFAVFDVYPGLRYRVGETEVVIEPDRPVTSVDLHVPEVKALGGVFVTVRDPDGRPYEWDNQVYVRRADNEAIVAQAQHRGPRFYAALEPGRYEALVEAERLPLGWCDPGFDFEPTKLRPGRAAFDVVQGAETKLDVRFGHGGSLSLTLEVPEELRDVLPLDPRLSPDRCSAVAKAVREDGPCPTAFAVPDGGGEEIPLELRNPGCVSWFTSPRVVPGLATRTKTILPAGLYVVHARSATHEWESVLVLVREDEVTDCQLRLR